MFTPVDPVWGDVIGSLRDISLSTPVFPTRVFWAPPPYKQWGEQHCLVENNAMLNEVEFE